MMARPQLVAALLGALAAAAPAGEESLLGRPEGPALLPAGWTHVEVPSTDRRTVYTTAAVGSAVTLRAVARNAASFVVRRVTPRGRTAALRWSWRVDVARRPGDGLREETDDLPARLWVGFQTDWASEPWSERHAAAEARERYGFTPPGYWLHYVWSGPGRERGDTGACPYAPGRVRYVVLRGDGAPLRAWRNEEVDPAADYARLFGEPAPPVRAVAFMSDSDDRGGGAVAFLRDLVLVVEGPGER